MRTRKQLLLDYHIKLHDAVCLDLDEIEVVSHKLTGDRIADGRAVVPIDEYIETLRSSIKAMLNGANHEDYQF